LQSEKTKIAATTDISLKRRQNMARKTISVKDKNRLYALSGNKCAFPDCNEEIANPKNTTVVSEICHIEAAEQSGVRYNPDSDDDCRNNFENLILLCPNHHTEIDNPDNASKYTVEVLRKMKQEHEAKMLKPEQLQKNPSVLNEIIKLIGNKLFDNQENETQNVPNPQEKIHYNNVMRYKPIIEEYKVYQGKLNKLYAEIENYGSTRKEILLKNIRNIYLQERTRYDTIEKIQANADNIIDKIKDKLWELVENVNLDREAIEVALLVLIVDAFMRCDILEVPK
jgi:hypothetical protein